MKRFYSMDPMRLKKLTNRPFEIIDGSFATHLEF